MLKILDIGCGKGENCIELGRKNNHSKIFGVDISKENIDEARRRNLLSNVEFLQGRGEKLSFNNNVFDEIYLLEVLEHVDNPKKTLQECSRVLKENGKLIITVPYPKSELILEKENKKYPEQIGHQRRCSKEYIVDLAKENLLKLLKYKKYNSSEHLMWKYLFKRKFEITDQNGNLNKPMPRIVSLSSSILNQDNLFNHSIKKRKFGYVIYYGAAVLYPLSKFLDYIVTCKKHKFVFIKK